MKYSFFLKKLIYFISLLGILLCYSPLPALAQSDTSAPTSLGVSPAIIDKVTPRGKLVIGKVEVFNLTNLPLPVKAFITSFSPSDLVNIPDSKRNIYDASTWITVQEPDFILQPKARRIVSYTIRAAKNAEPGGHYATILFQPLVPETAVSPHNLFIVGRVGALVLMTVPGDFREDAKISELQVPPFSQTAPVTIRLGIENIGNIYLRPNGKIEIVNTQGKVIFAKPLNEGLIIPGTTKTYEVSFGNNTTFGRFRAQALVIFGSDQKHLIAQSAWFWIVPYIQMGIVSIFGIGIILLLIKMRRRIILAAKVLLGKDVSSA